MPSALVPAAGSASRFGGGKLAALVEGVPLLDRTIGALLDAGIGDVLVILPPQAPWTGEIHTLTDPRVRTTRNPDPSRGMFSSIQIGFQDFESGPVAVLPGDMPFVRAETVKTIVATAVRTGGIVSPRFQGRRGHPIVIPGDLRETILSAPADAMLNDVLRSHSARFVNIDVDDKGVLRDVDVKEDLMGSERVGGFAGAEPPEE